MRRMLCQPHAPAVVALNVYGFRFPNRGMYQRVSWGSLCACKPALWQWGRRAVRPAGGNAMPTEQAGLCCNTSFPPCSR